MEVIIVSKTHMSNTSCVGGVLDNGRFVRLLDENGHNQDVKTSLNIGDVYTISFKEKSGKKSPHIEDILVLQLNFKYSFSSIENMVQHLIEKLRIKIWRGGIHSLFDGNIQWTGSGSGYVSDCGSIPENSVGFWISDQNLTRKDYEGKIRYNYPHGWGEGKWRSIPFVGFQSPVDSIPAGTLLRVSLARWWSAKEGEEKRCYLQLSGWYGLAETRPVDNDHDDFDDLSNESDKLSDLPF